MSELIEIKLSNRTTVKIKELDGWTSSQAESMAGGLIGKTTPDDMQAKIGLVLTKVYALGSIVEINGRPVTPLQNEIEYRKVAQALSFGECAKLLERWTSLFGGDSDEDLKNDSAAQPSTA